MQVRALARGLLVAAAMNPSAPEGFDDLDHSQQATLIDDPEHPRQLAMRALVEAERAKIAAEVIVGVGDETRLGSLIGGPHDQPAHALVPIHRQVPDANEPGTVRAFQELPLPEVSPRPPSLQAEWLELEERPASSAPMVRAVSDESLARQACVPPANVIRSTNPPPGPERSVVVQQVSPFGSDARVVAKPKPKPSIPPQGETLPFASGAAEQPPKARSFTPSEWAVAGTASDVPSEPDSCHAQVVAIQGDVQPQRYIPTVVHLKPQRAASPTVRRDLLPLTSALCAVVVAVAALVNVLV